MSVMWSSQFQELHAFHFCLREFYLAFFSFFMFMLSKEQTKKKMAEMTWRSWAKHFTCRTSMPFSDALISHCGQVCKCWFDKTYNRNDFLLQTRQQKGECNVDKCDVWQDSVYLKLKTQCSWIWCLSFPLPLFKIFLLSSRLLLKQTWGFKMW